MERSPANRATTDSQRHSGQMSVAAIAMGSGLNRNTRISARRYDKCWLRNRTAIPKYRVTIGGSAVMPGTMPVIREFEGFGRREVTVLRVAQLDARVKVTWHPQPDGRNEPLSRSYELPPRIG